MRNHKHHRQPPRFGSALRYRPSTRSLFRRLLALLVTLLSVVVACDDNAKPDDQKGSAKPPWLAALESKDFDYQGLVEDEYGDLDEVTVKIDFGSVVSTKAMRIPVTIGYQGPERSNSIRGLLLGADAVDAVVVASGAGLGSSQAAPKRVASNSGRPRRASTKRFMP